jgi:co-chaperonin GroES (HSP10)
MPTSAQKRAFRDRIKPAALQAVPDTPPVPKIPKKYRTLNGFYLVERLDMDDAMSAGGIHKPEIARQRSQRGKIRWAAKDEQELTTGMTVIFTKYGGSDIEINGEKLVLVQRLQIYAIEEDDVAVTV